MGAPVAPRAPIAPRLFLIVFGIARIFILGCFALLSLGVAIDPSSSILNRILGGLSAAAMSVLAAVLLYRGIKRIAAR